MMEAEMHVSDGRNPLFDRKEFRKFSLCALTELQNFVQRYLSSHELKEHQTGLIWRKKLPSFQDNALSVLFKRFPAVRGAFDYRQTERKLCTLDNLSQLVKTGGPCRLARTFQEFFESKAFQEWKILVPVENVRVQKDFLGAKGESVELRWLTSEERDQLKVLLPENKFDDLYFSVTQQAGDSESAIFQARARIREFLAPYYLHRIRNPDQWWRVRTIRQIVSPLAFYLGPANLPGAKMELWQFPTEASDLFTPDPEIEPDWKSAVGELTQAWGDSDSEHASDHIKEHLKLCNRWMFSAESDELMENAFLKHAIAWEALLPSKVTSLRRCWYLLLLCRSSSDPLCMKTVSEASRLVDRRNSLAHPEIKRELYGTIESDLIKLKQSLWWGFDNSLRIWQSPGGHTLDWPQVLSQCYFAALSDDAPADYDDSVFNLFDVLGYIERDENGIPALSRDGQRLRIEAHITRARELWPDTKNPKESVCLIARALQIATDEDLSPHQYHSLLMLKERNESMDRAVFEEGWRLAMTGNTPPTEAEIASKLNDIERAFDVNPELVGWKRP